MRKSRFASQSVLAGGSIEKLALILGHSTPVLTSERYAHMRPDLFPEADYEVLDIDLAGAPATVRQIRSRTP